MSKSKRTDRRFSRIKLRVPKRVSKLKLPRNILRGRTAASDAKLHDAIQNLPRITNETVAEHREEVLASARKYIYPLSHSKRRVVSVTVGLLVLAVISFFMFCLTALYKVQSTSTFVYGVTQVVPFPVGRVGGSWISYENYLFELRHTMHYYQTQQKQNFTDKSGQRVLAKLKQDAMAQVIEDAYVKKLAAQNHVSVSNQEVNNAVTVVRNQNRLGSNDQVFRDVLSEFWGWTQDDFKRELKSQLLAQKVASKLDIATLQRAQTALDQLNAGADFSAVAKAMSDDAATKANGGDYGIAVDKSNRDLAPQLGEALFSLPAGQHSGIINTGYTLEIVKVIDVQANKVHAQHISFNIQPITTYVKPLQASQKSHTYISVK